jgi:GNAT superfamily N-acetyltransferase
MSEVWWDEADGTRLYLLDDPADDQWARDHAAANPPPGTAMLGANAFSPSEEAAVRAAGFHLAFTRVQMSVDLVEPSLPKLPQGFELRPASPADHRAVFDGNAEVFGTSSLGYIQDTFDEFEKEIAEDYPDYSLWTLAWAGDELAGWVISSPVDTPWVGVRPQWRRRGLATALMRANHFQLWTYGVRTASLWTIEENPTGSVALYASLGYRIVTREPRYRKAFCG